MRAIWASIMKFITGDGDINIVNEAAFIIAVVLLIIALYISIVLAKKNHLYGRYRQKDEQINIHKENEVA